MELKNKINYEDSEEIKELLERDTLKRNKHLNNIIKIFNNISSPITLSIDGDWGTGKTIFAKQLECIANFDDIKDVRPHYFNGETIKFRENFDLYYFNSWEYDMYEEPLEIFLHDLLKHRLNTMIRQDKNIENLRNIMQKYLLPLAKNSGKVLSGGFFDFEELFEGETRDEKLLKTTAEVDDLKKRVSEILKALTEEKNIIIIIDELDRCKPTFAVELLETIKHYFSYDKISYIICSNKSELSHTIKQYYGQEFNGYGYLDRFIDFEYNLPEPDIDTYIHEVFKIPEIEGYDTLLTDQNKAQFINIIEVNARYFNLTLRQINKYCLLSELIISQFIKRRGEQSSTYLLIFPLYAIGLKLTNLNLYKNFIEGKSATELKKYLEDNEELFLAILEYNDNYTHANSTRFLIDMTKDYNRIVGSGREELFDSLTYID